MEPRPRTKTPATPIAAWTTALGADVRVTLRVCDRGRKRCDDGRPRRQQDQIVLAVRCVGAPHLEVNLTHAEALAAVRARPDGLAALAAALGRVQPPALSASNRSEWRELLWPALMSGVEAFVGPQGPPHELPVAVVAAVAAATAAAMAPLAAALDPAAIDAAAVEPTPIEPAAMQPSPPPVYCSSCRRRIGRAGRGALLGSGGAPGQGACAAQHIGPAGLPPSAPAAHRLP
eukprot:scaffold35862_cov27-Tisochrysis_lutea.AAC.1